MRIVFAAFKVLAVLILAVISESFNLAMKTGGHAQNFKFLPLLRGSRSFHFPRIIQIAGVYPDLTPDDLLAPKSMPAVGAGLWAYDFPDKDSPDQGTVAIPGSAAITDCIDPVVMITTNTALGVVLTEEVEMLVVVDRGDRYFTPECFFVFRTPEDSLVLQWSDRLEPGYEVMGRVALCTVPYAPSMGTASTGFAETDGEDDD
jgi:Rubisco Assembly chaperone C-terminal domain